ncbi:hypothetical protein [Clostridium botulinum]|uniref:hypothetical protein n=1 Tax=Clostridium botulinum TaxID=1491 RepID=UPI00388F7F40
MKLTFDDVSKIIEDISTECDNSVTCKKCAFWINGDCLFSYLVKETSPSEFKQALERRFKQN